MSSDKEIRDALVDLLQELHAEAQAGWRGDCPYYARYAKAEGHDPRGTCGYGCQDEPACVTSVPADGWGDPPDESEYIADALAANNPLEFAPGRVLMIGERVPADAMNGHDMALALAEFLRGDGGGMNGHTVAAEMLEFIAPQLLFRAVTAEEADDE